LPEKSSAAITGGHDHRADLDLAEHQQARGAWRRYAQDQSGSGGACRGVELGYELAGGGEVFALFFELKPQVDDLLVKLVELVPPARRVRVENGL
jgi:hypothetical protein